MNSSSFWQRDDSDGLSLGALVKLTSRISKWTDYKVMCLPTKGKEIIFE